MQGDDSKVESEKGPEKESKKESKKEYFSKKKTARPIAHYRNKGMYSLPCLVCKGFRVNIISITTELSENQTPEAYVDVECSNEECDKVSTLKICMDNGNCVLSRMRDQH